jgi:hypothetical protein
MQQKRKIRCSAIGKIMGTSKTKLPLTQTAISLCEEMLIEEIYNYKDEISNKYLTKGIIVEDESIDLINKLLFQDYEKNTNHYENDFIKGTPDIVSNVIIDVKSSFSPKTFPVFDTIIPNKDYYYQLQGYMWLTGIKKAKLIYCLINTPEHLVRSEARSLAFNLGYSEDEAYEKVIQNHVFDYVPIDKRIKIFDVEYDELVIEKIKEKVIDCNKYMDELITLK